MAKDIGWFLVFCLITAIILDIIESIVEKKKNSSQSHDYSKDAIDLAKIFEMAFHEQPVDIKKMNNLSEDMICMARRLLSYNTKDGDTGYYALLHATQQTGYFYSGNNYPNKLLEDLLQDEFNKVL